MAVIEPLEKMPAHFVGAKAEAWERSMIRWGLRYGSTAAQYDHTAAYFGLVPLGIGIAWAWAEVREKRPSYRMLKTGKLAFETILFGRPWIIYAKCADLPSKKFAEFLGFTHEGFDGTDYLMRRRPQ